MTNTMTAKEFREARELYGDGQEQWADRIGKSRKQINAMEGGATITATTAILVRMLVENHRPKKRKKPA